MLYKLFQTVFGEFIIDYGDFVPEHCNYPAYVVIEEADERELENDYKVIQIGYNPFSAKYLDLKIRKSPKYICDVEVDWRPAKDSRETTLTLFSKSGDVIIEDVIYEPELARCLEVKPQMDAITL